MLDAAEIAFATHGYQGASMRDIATRAGVRLGLVHYHFGSKEQLFRAAVMRGQPQLVTLITTSFADAERAAAPDELTVEQTIDAFVRPFLEVRISSVHPLRVYVRMTSHLMSSYRVPELRNVLATLGEVTELFESRLCRLLPAFSRSDFYTALYLIEASLIFMVQDPGFLDDLSRGHHSADALDRLAGPMVRLFGAGLRGIPSAIAATVDGAEAP